MLAPESRCEPCMMELPLADTRELVAGLRQTPACIAPKYFYDSRGSELFEAITRLPEYYLTRTEREVMHRHGEAIAHSIGAVATLVELGAGSCEKARALCRLIRPAHFVAVDISTEFLAGAVARLRQEFPALDARTLAADLTRAIELPADLPRAGRLVFFPGSSLGNFDPHQALDLLTRMRGMIEHDGGLLIGIDLAKDMALLDAAYNDAAGVTAAFNLNMLSHVNRLIAADFDPRQWRHRAFFNPVESRIEMHLVAAEDLLVRWRGGQRRFAAGEWIHTENSYKYPLDEFLALLARAGFLRAEAWTDERNWFAVVLGRP